VRISNLSVRAHLHPDTLSDVTTARARRLQGAKRGQGNDHRRSPKVYFRDMGLYSLTAAHQLACQSLTWAH
jgi:hypothetical protein